MTVLDATQVHGIIALFLIGVLLSSALGFWAGCIVTRPGPDDPGRSWTEEEIAQLRLEEGPGIMARAMTVELPSARPGSHLAQDPFAWSEVIADIRRSPAASPAGDRATDFIRRIEADTDRFISQMGNGQ